MFIISLRMFSTCKIQSTWYMKIIKVHLKHRNYPSTLNLTSDLMNIENTVG
jgi:hypothetical protein